MLIPLGILLTLWLLLPLLLPTTPQLTYTQFVRAVDDGKVASVAIDSQGAASGTLKDGTHFTTAIPIALSGDGLLERLENNDVTIEAVPPRASLVSLLLSFAPFLVLGWFWIQMGRRAGTQFGGILGVGRSRAKVFDTERPNTTFADIAGYEGVKLTHPSPRS